MAAPLPPGVAVRVCAAGVLDAVLHRGRSLKAELAAALPGLSDPRDRALLEAICFAALRHRARYDAALAAWMPRPLPRRDAPLRALLHAGFAQLDPLALAAHAALAATVEAARGLGRQHQAGLVNALLRRAQRDGLPAAPADAAWPEWLRAQVRSDWGDATAAEIFAAGAVQAPTWLRVNRTRSTVAGYAERLREAGIEAQASADLPDALRIDVPVSPATLPGFAEGEVSVQDAAAQRVADALSPAAGAHVLDACAAPGGKSAHLLERDPSLRLTALDLDPRRLRRVAETHARLGVGDGAVLRAVDASAPATWWDGEPFDAILIDAPCSATGIIRRQPDVLLHRRPSDIAALTALQARLLDALWPLLAPGGRLLYATCSILAAENEAQVAAFLSRTPAATALPLAEAFGHATGHGRQRLPGEQGMDGFFYAALGRAPG
ncbi:16S rRNA (cytosine(967)-C(5))-methyltransferase RsmB [Luteimonas kalidii]|uniref:16S rRNA (cytosine(967)-C(5))-methyltransferase n=1 Tax=Luteimonas kalidii TaxID=3042025 RepID=A0ABT6JVQ4_9GAMM|nr:16S rRNA (cytosine(967)-C(5))-methyltransferase RsmB [Luteimonas kalidii]MDH5834256.1 16S rRNA (cytosine(967)-C(5))-methyltransferase RsmB [Luteimonas kalidii]